MMMQMRVGNKHSSITQHEYFVYEKIHSLESIDITSVSRVLFFR